VQEVQLKRTKKEQRTSFSAESGKDNGYRNQ